MVSEKQISVEPSKAIFENGTLKRIFHPELYFDDRGYDETRIKLYTLGYPQSKEELKKYSITSFGYLPANSVAAWEHNVIHDVDIYSLETYCFDIPPLICERKNGKIVLVEDGNHRVNTLNMFNADLPVIIIKNNVAHTRLRYLHLMGLVFQPL